MFYGDLILKRAFEWMDARAAWRKEGADLVRAGATLDDAAEALYNILIAQRVHDKVVAAMRADPEFLRINNEDVEIIRLIEGTPLEESNKG